MNPRDLHIVCSNHYGKVVIIVGEMRVLTGMQAAAAVLGETLCVSCSEQFATTVYDGDDLCAACAREQAVLDASRP
jgi:hypothetical protein